MQIYKQILKNTRFLSDISLSKYKLVIKNIFLSSLVCLNGKRIGTTISAIIDLCKLAFDIQKYLDFLGVSNIATREIYTIVFL